MYGVTKVSGELLCDYYAARFGLDVRGLRLPGLISYMAPPGGGTTDYAVEIFYQALRYKHYRCFLGPATRLDMMYMPDATRAMIELMEADSRPLRYRNAYNVTAMSITLEDLAAEIRRHIPDWGWAPHFDLAAMSADMLARLGEKVRGPKEPGRESLTRREAEMPLRGCACRSRH
jgi:nucleoside-diphosphate-sugar epimerase